MLATFNSKRNQSAIKEFRCYGGTLFVDVEQLDEKYFACKFHLTPLITCILVTLSFTFNFSINFNSCLCRLVLFN